MRTKRNLIKVFSATLTVCLVCALSTFLGGANFVKAETLSVEIAGQTVDISSFETYNGASIRYDTENKGIRFVTGISQTAYDEINKLVSENEGYSVEYGTIVTYSYRVQKCIDLEYDFTKEALEEVVETEGSKYIDFGVKVFRETPDVAGNVEYTAVLGIQETNYNIPMSARGYMVISDGETQNVYYAKYQKLNSTAENVSHALLEDFVKYGVDSDTKLEAIAEYTKNETKDGYFMSNEISMMPYTNNSDNVSIEANQSIGGRSGVTKYTLKTSSAGWTERLMPTFTSQNLTWTSTNASATGHEKSVKRQTTMGFKYVLFDIYLQDAFSLYFPTVNRKHAYVKFSTNGNLVYMYDGAVTTDTAITDKVKVYNAGGTAQVTATYSGIWYTIAIDISCNIGLGYNSACDTSLSFSAANAGVYYDNLRFYRTDAWKQDIVQGSAEMDFSEFGVMVDGGSIAKFGIGSMGGRDDVLLFKEDSPTTTSRVGFMFTSGFGSLAHADANKRIATSGIKYISFDVCRGDNSNFIMYVWDTASTNLKVAYDTDIITNSATNVKIFDKDGNVPTTMNPNEWYTIVIEVKADTAGGWSAINWQSTWTNMAIDNIVYYYNDVPTLWK